MKVSKQSCYWLLFFLPSWMHAQTWQYTYEQEVRGNPRCMAVQPLDKNGYALFGVNLNFSNYELSRGVQLRVDQNGQVLWLRYDTFYVHKVAVTPDSGFITVGWTAIMPRERSFVQKLDKFGQVQWSIIQSEHAYTDRIYSITPTSDGGYVYQGVKGDSMYLQKLDPFGNKRWRNIWRERTINLYVVNPQPMLELPSGDLLFHNAGSSGDVVRADASGNILWRRPVLQRGITEMVADSKAITYIEDLGCIWQLDSLGNVRNTNCIPPNSAYPHLIKRRLGGYWAGSNTFTQTGTTWNLFRLDSNLNIMSNKIIFNQDYDFSGFLESSDSSLFFYGHGLRGLKVVMMLTDTAGKLHQNLIRGALTSPCGSRFKDWSVTATRSDGAVYLGKVDSLNRYVIETDTGRYTIRAIPPSLSWESSVGNVAQLSLPRIDTIPLTIHCLANCPDLNVDISTPILRRCFSNDYSVSYCNNGTIPATGAYVEVKLDSLLDYLNASIPWTSRVGQRLRFNLGTVQPNDCQTFTIGVKVACGDSTRLGQSLCTEVRIYPDTICTHIPTWTGANLRVQGACERDSVHFTVSNTGRSASSAVRRMTVENANIVSNALINVGANAQLHYRFPANGNTWRMSVEQEPNHPYGNHPVAVLEGCRNNLITPISTGFLQQLPLDTRLPTARTYCMTLVGAYDPNDKMSFPAGYGANRQMEPNQDLEYMIRFQNTGTDTAFTVVIKDTLSNLLDATSVQPLAASHRYEWTILKNNVLQFTFPNVLLVDSFHNEPKSHGFIKFHIKQKPNVALGSKIYNSAAIYFDFNPPVITNRTMLTVGKQFILSGIVNPTSKVPMRILNYPNPTLDRAILELLGGTDDNATRTFQLYDATGRLLRQANFNGNRYEFERDGLNTGIYQFRVTQSGQMLGTGSLVIQSN